MTFVPGGTRQKFQLVGKKVDDVALGAIIKHSLDWNLTRECVLGSGTRTGNLLATIFSGLAAPVWRPPSKSRTRSLSDKFKWNRGRSGFQLRLSDGIFEEIHEAPDPCTKISRNLEEIPSLESIFSFSEIKPVLPGVTEAPNWKSMGQHCEMMAKTWKISRTEQDELSLASHQNGIRAYESGFYRISLQLMKVLQQDGFLRKDTSMERLAKLKPAFDFSGAGTLTAGKFESVDGWSFGRSFSIGRWSQKKKLAHTGLF